MARSELAYLRLLPDRSSHLDLADSKELIAYLCDLPASSFELIIKGESGQASLIIGLPEENIPLVRRHIYSLCPGLNLVKIRPQDLIARPQFDKYYRFARHYAYPLAGRSADDALPMLLGHISQTGKRQSVELRLTASSCSPLKVRLLRRRLLNGQKPLLASPIPLGYLGTGLFSFIALGSLLIKASLYTAQNLMSGAGSSAPRTSPKLVSSKSIIHLDKLYEPLFKTSLNVRVKAPASKQAAALAGDMERALSGFAAYGYQGFKRKRGKEPRDLYSIGDLAAFYHFGSSDIKSGVIGVSHSKVLPTPKEYLGIKQLGDQILGVSSYRGLEDRLLLKQSARERHLYVSGATGSGKSTMLANLIYQDMEAGLGITLIDPHGDLAEEVVRLVPKSRESDVIYFDPTDFQSSISINLLEIKASPGSSDYKLEADQVAEATLSLFRKVFSDDDSGGHRIEYILRNCIHTAIALPGSTIFTIFQLLTDSRFRLEAVSNLEDPNLVNFWRNELGRAGEYQRVKMSAGVTSKIGRLLFYEPAKQVFNATRSTLDLKTVMDQKKILICNFSKGRLGEDGSRLFATSMLTKLQLSALARSTVEPKHRADHYLYLDEFQNYTPSVVIQMLSEARKYGLYLTMAEQSPSQQEMLATNVILANVGTMICFRASSPRDIKLLLPSFDDYLSPSDLNNLPAFNFYLKSISDEVGPPASGRSYPLPSRDYLGRAADIKPGPGYKLAEAVSGA